MAKHLFAPGDWVQAKVNLTHPVTSEVFIPKGAVHQVSAMVDPPGWMHIALCPRLVIIKLVGVDWPEETLGCCQCAFVPIRRNPDLIEGLLKGVDVDAPEEPARIKEHT
jgi:hypothetical protein